MEHVDVRWMSLFADVPSGDLQRAVTYWQDVTAAAAGPAQGDHGQYTPLQPVAGDPYLWLQRVDRAAGGWHPDLHVISVAEACDIAGALGAQVVHADDTLAVLASPSGLPFCLVREGGHERRRPAAPAWPGGLRSEVDQICLDIPAGRFDAEAGFWATLTGWPRRHGDLPEYDILRVAEDLPLRVLLQRLGDDDSGGARAHADLACDDRAAETARNIASGGVVVLEAEHWTTLRDPAGLLYCITDRRPLSG